MNKERLEKIIYKAERTALLTKPPKPLVTIPDEDFEWFIEQVERVHELEEENKRQREALEEIEEHAVWGMFANKYVIMARKGLGLLKEED